MCVCVTYERSDRRGEDGTALNQKGHASPHEQSHVTSQPGDRKGEIYGTEENKQGLGL